MWGQAASAVAESDGEDSLSSEDEGDIQCEILEKQRDAANQRLSELEQVSSQLLKEMDVLEIQFQVERSCRENAEALAVKVTKENKVLKRRSQMLMPLIPELPERNMAAVTSDLQADPSGDDDPGGLDEEAPLQSLAKITDLQVAVDSLLAEKLQLEQQVEIKNREQVQLQEQLALEVEEKEDVLKKVIKQNNTINNLKRVSQLVTDEFSDLSHKLELEQGLRQHAEVFAHQMLVQKKEAHRQSTETSLQLHTALEQVASINTALCHIQHCYQAQVKQSESAVEESNLLSELQNLRGELERSREERKALEAQLSEAQHGVKQLQEEVEQLQETLKKEKTDYPEEESSIPPPPPPPPTTVIKRKDGVKADQNKAVMMVDVKARAVEEMMERIRKGIVLKVTSTTQAQEDESSWKDQRNENRKSAILELKGMLDTVKRHEGHWRAPSRKRMSRNVGEAELLLVLQRRRRAMGEGQDQPSTKTHDRHPGQLCVPAGGAVPWAGESGGAPVLRRLKQNREKRDSRIRASTLIVSQEN